MPRSKSKNNSLSVNKRHSPEQEAHPGNRALQSSAKLSIGKLRRLRETAKAVRAQVLLDREHIADEARAVGASALADGKLTKLTLLLRSDEADVLEAIDTYAAAHGLKSRNQVLRLALSKLLGINLDRPH